MKVQGIIGAALMAAGGFSPLMHLPIIGNWNYFDIDIRLAIAYYVLVVLGFAGAFTGRAGLMRFAGWGGIVLALITLAGIYFKAHDSFSFLHFKKLVNFAAGMVKYRWGWYLVVGGAFVLALVRKRQVVNAEMKQPQVQNP